MEYVSDFTVTQFWKERYNLSPKEILGKTNSRMSHEIINATFDHFTDASFNSSKVFQTTFTIPGSNVELTTRLRGVTGFTSLTTMKKLTQALEEVQEHRDKLIDKETRKHYEKEDRLKKIQEAREIIGGSGFGFPRRI